MEKVELNFTQAVLDSGRVPGNITAASSEINGWVSAVHPQSKTSFHPTW
jgi:hypothetical protein